MFSARKILAALGVATSMLVTPVVGSQASAESTQPAAPRELCYENFQAFNAAAFAMWFRMESRQGVATAWTPDGAAYPVGQSRTIDLGELGFADGTAFRFEGSAALGKRFYSEYFDYCRNGQTKALVARGTTLNNWWAGD